MEQYGFALPTVATWVWETSVEYATATATATATTTLEYATATATATATLAVARSLELNEVEAQGQREPDWLRPGQPVSITMNFTHEPVSMHELVRLRVPCREPELTALGGLSAEALAGRLQRFAAVLAE